ncbi:DUF2065 domain-containing protein [Parvibaculum sp.]|uniref:DUF2065 domain-containing protein n=1 Tax=Parvibaculum sp. TaxID=2024848 RepID=UPI000EBC501A|nr:DUF2065 domain-containing protein [Parvibaculum sp.]MBO6668871.1 DUF2065 domain-containing protein [Parvibaculum sp.]MBO6692424.1 DUF2065 domain-containing protein [Parvibaculum sp.]MBO6715731.1 DUF2065 domain-containing protein [Parvibaculum sp.]HAC56944.1 DUF2065 domain-containing protein [Rhodobiaceae bacterium]
MGDFLTAIGLALVIEGVLYAGFPGPMRRALMSVSGMPEHSIRMGGLMALAIGVFVVWLVRG